MEQTSNHISVAANITWKVRNRAQEIPSCSGAYHGYNNVSLFSSSLLVLQHEKLNFTDSEYGIQSTDDASSKVNKLSDDMEHEDSFKEFAQQVIGTLLPDDEDELLAGIMDDFDLNRLPSQVEELEEYNLFGSSGGMELDSDPTESLTTGMAKTHISDNYVGNGTVQYNLPNGVGTFAGEHPYGEHPSRTLFVRNISSNVEDSELQSLFEKYGDIRSLYTACKHRGFVMMSYYDIRAARTAMRALQNKPLRRRKLDIHFSIPKVNLSDKDLNQGTLVVFNLDPSVSNDDLHRISRAYGEVKETRETPHKRQHKFIEFYDVRAAEAAVGSLNKSDITGKRIKLEPSRPGGARWKCLLMQQLNPELEHDETRCYRPQVGSPITKSPPGTPQRCCWQPLMKITRNKCNVGYAFINMLSPSDIISFYQAFNGKRWDKFNSEQVASLAYARIQGKAALVAHFQNSSLMNEDKCCPILINSEGPESGDQESSIPNGTNKVLQQDDTYLGDMSESPAKNKPNEKLDDNSLPGRSSGEE